MSSFTIDKKEYIKAAGLLYGIEAAKTNNNKWYLDHLYNDFVRCYELNLASVNERYDENIKPNKNEYLGVFEEYKKKGNKLYFSTKKKELANGLWFFFRSALYQTDNGAMAQEMGAIFFRCVSKLFESDIYNSVSWWGEIDITLLGKKGVEQ
jgi:hypothetical protein